MWPRSARSAAKTDSANNSRIERAGLKAAFHCRGLSVKRTLQMALFPFSMSSPFRPRRKRQTSLSLRHCLDKATSMHGSQRAPRGLCLSVSSLLTARI